MRELRRSSNKILFGVAAGMAEYFDMDPVIWRAIWAVAGVAVPPTILAYVILGIIMPPPEDENVIDLNEKGEYARSGGGRRYKPMTKSYDRWLSGVAGGIAEYFDTDPVLVRALFVITGFMGVGLVAYIVLAILMPQPKYQ